MRGTTLECQTRSIQGIRHYDPRIRRIVRAQDDSGSGRSPHNDRRVDQAKRDRLLARHAGDAVHLRAAQPRETRREPSLLRPGRWPAADRFHQRVSLGCAAGGASGSRMRGASGDERLARDVHPGSGAFTRARHRVHPARSRFHGLNLPAGPERAENRARLLQIRDAGRVPRR